MSSLQDSRFTKCIKNDFLAKLVYNYVVEKVKVSAFQCKPFLSWKEITLGVGEGTPLPPKRERVNKNVI